MAKGLLQQTPTICPRCHSGTWPRLRQPRRQLAFFPLLLPCGRDCDPHQHKHARDRSRTQEPSVFSSTPSRFRTPKGFPPSYSGNRLAGEDPVRQSNQPEQTAPVWHTPLLQGWSIPGHANLDPSAPRLCCRVLAASSLPCSGPPAGTPTRPVMPQQQPRRFLRRDGCHRVPDRPGNVATSPHDGLAFPSFS